jgi:Protein of unknown function (DUF2752)
MIAKPAAVRIPFPAWTGIAVLFCGLLAASVMLFLFDPTRYPFYPVCLFHRWTGWNCPGCGSLRAMHQLLHCHLLAALRDNILLILSIPCLAVCFVRWLLRWRSGVPVALPAVRPKFFLWFLAVLLVFTFIRNLPCAPFIYLSPP